LRGNAGIDQFRMVEAAADNGIDLIRDFTIGTDVIGIGQSLLSNTFNLAGSVGTAAGAAVAAADYIDGRSDISNIVAGDTLRIIELQSGLTAAQIAGQTSGAGAAVEALVLVFNTTTGRSELWYDDDWTSTATRSQLVTFDNITTIGQHQGFTQASFVEFVV